LLAVTAVLLLVAPAAAVAGSTYRVSGGSLVYTSHLSATHGYRIQFSENERRGRHFNLTVEGHHATVTYELAGGGAPADGIAVDLGRRGRFDLRFVPAGKVRTLGIGSGCEGPKGRWQHGYLVGLGRFRGERDYTEIHLRRIGAISESWSAIRCHYVEGGRDRGVPRRAHLSARRDGIEFGASLERRDLAPFGSRALFRALDYDRAGRMWIAREVKVRAPESTFTFPGGPKLPEDVALAPPGPFTGSATFSRTPESTFAWSGDLAVAFPGTGRIPLAGQQFSVEVCALEGCVHQEPEREPPS
jgi:hypothetical protein